MNNQQKEVVQKIRQDIESNGQRLEMTDDQLLEMFEDSLCYSLIDFRLACINLGGVISKEFKASDFGKSLKRVIEVLNK